MPIVRCPACQKKVQFADVVEPTLKKCPCCNGTLMLRPPAPPLGEAPVKVCFEECDDRPSWLPDDPPPRVPKRSQTASFIPTARLLRNKHQSSGTIVSDLAKWIALGWTFLCGAWFLFSVYMIFEKPRLPPIVDPINQPGVELFFAIIVFAFLWLIPVLGLVLISLAFKK